MAGGWGKLHGKELQILCSLPYIIRLIKLRRVRGAVHVVRIGDMINACNIFVGQPERMRPHGRRKRRREDVIKVYLKKQERKICVGLIWMVIGINCWALVNMVMDF